jgi:hypothetical protein
MRQRVAPASGGQGNAITKPCHVSAAPHDDRSLNPRGVRRVSGGKRGLPGLPGLREAAVCSSLQPL